MEYTVEHQCPQCGAPVDMEETTRLLSCPYCNVKNYLFFRDCARLVLPSSVMDKNLMYAPYLRFKGSVFVCRGVSVSHRIVDITCQGAGFKELPLSLGFRPQAVKMKFVDPEINGPFLACHRSIDDVLDRVDRHTARFIGDDFFHRAYIGEALSLIYLPIFVEENRLYDALANQCISHLSEGKGVFPSSTEANPQWRVRFFATICPNCGWDLEGEKDSVVLTCPNCHTAWEAWNEKFVRRTFQTVPGTGEEVLYLPFWKIAATSGGIEIRSYADFIRVTNQPRVVQNKWEDDLMYFWVPAFKIRPNIFLHLARQMTVRQRKFETIEEFPKGELHPVTLPFGEAVQSMKLVLASAGMQKQKLFPLLPRVTFTVGDSQLIYLPFYDMGQEIIQEHMNVSIYKKTLEFGRHL